LEDQDAFVGALAAAREEVDGGVGDVSGGREDSRRWRVVHRCGASQFEETCVRFARALWWQVAVGGVAGACCDEGVASGLPLYARKGPLVEKGSGNEWGLGASADLGEGCGERDGPSAIDDQVEAFDAGGERGGGVSLNSPMK
jgi:hypothetical protein